MEIIVAVFLSALGAAVTQSQPASPKPAPTVLFMCPHGAAVRISFKDLARVSETLSA